MSLLEFAEKMKCAVQDYMGEEVTVVSNQVTKNNGITLESLSIMEKEKNISPTIYLNHFYTAYSEGVSFSEIFKQVIEVYQNHRVCESMDMEFFTDYSKVKKKIVYKLINFEKNKELLEEIPHIKYLDLAIVFYCVVLNEQIGNGSILIYHKHAAMWGVTTEELYERAKENTPRLFPGEIRSMLEVIRQIMENDLRKEYTESGKDESGESEWINAMLEQMLTEMAESEMATPMYVLSNQTRTHGAVCMLYENILQECAGRLQDDLYILPSSIHELILIPAAKTQNITGLNNMIQEVNTTQVEDEEILSGHAYYYSREHNVVSQM